MENKPSNLQENDDGDQSVHLCDPCSEDEVQTPAEAFCKVCSQLFCKNCLKFHERNRTTKSHQIHHGAEMIRFAAEKTSGNSSKKDFIKLKCGSHQSENLEHFCEKHKVVTCTICNLVDHRNCEIVPISEKVAERSFHDNAQKTLMDATDLLAKFEELASKYKTHASETKLQREVIAQSLPAKSIKQKNLFNKCLNDLESILNNLINKEMKNLQSKLTDTDNMKSVIQKQTEDYKRILKWGSDEEKRILTMLVEADIRDYCENLDKIRQNCYTVSSEEVLKKLDSLNQKFTNLGDIIGIEKVPVRRPFHDRKVALIGEMNISTEFGMSKITGLEIVSNDQVLVCDQKQHQIILLHMNYENLQAKQLYSVELPFMPYSMTLMDDDKALVSTNDNRLQEVRIIDGEVLILTETVELDHQYIRIVKCGQNLVAYERTDTKSSLSVISPTGEQISQITDDPENCLQSVGFMCLSPNKDTVYITTKKDGCIGISMTGETVFKYKADGVEYYQGVATDSEGYIYLAESDADNIVVINNKGEKVIDLFTSKGMHPNYLAFNEKLDKMLVVQGKSRKIKAFNLDG